MELQHIDLTDLKPATINVRKKGGKEIADLVPSIRSLGLIQPLLVRPNCEGFEIVAGQRRYHALIKLSDEAKENGERVDPVPCIVMEEGDDAKAIEASLAENIARLPMHEIDQYKAFAALINQGRTVEDIAYQFGITERLVKQRLAIANLHPPILTAYTKEQIRPETVRSLTLATPKQQKAWWALYKSDDYPPTGQALKSWLFGGSQIPVDNALFDLSKYHGSIIADLFGEERYFDDAAKFWALQNEAIAKAKAALEEDGWPEVIVLDVGAYWSSWEYVATAKEDDGKVYIQLSGDGEVTFREGFLPVKEARRRKQAEPGDEGAAIPVDKPELTKPIQNYLALHRHAAVRTELLGASGIALRLGLAQMIAGSSLWSVQAEPQKAASEAIADSLASNKAQDVFAEQRREVLSLLGMDEDTNKTLVCRKDDWRASHDLNALYAKLLELDDASVMSILTFVVAETLPSGSALVEVLGKQLNVDMANYWTPDQTFFDLLRDKEAINATLRDIGGKAVADAHVSSTAKVQKKIIRDYLDGTRKGSRKDWQPRYMDFPARAYTKRGGIEAIDQWKAVKKHYKGAAV